MSKEYHPKEGLYTGDERAPETRRSSMRNGCIDCPPTAKVLDVGCGFGSNIIPLQECGHHVLGIEVNPKIVDQNRKKSIHCMTPGELKKNGDTSFDLILMSHVIEHFAPSPLIDFMDEYLDLLRPGGHLIIITPLSSDYFYDDFDHVKPHQPTGIKMVFGDETAQVQFYSRNKLTLKDVWFRKSHFRIHHDRSRHVRSPRTVILRALDYFSMFLYLLTFRFFGKKDGWLGLFQKAGWNPDGDPSGAFAPKTLPGLISWFVRIHQFPKAPIAARTTQCILSTKPQIRNGGCPPGQDQHPGMTAELAAAGMP